MIVVPVETFVQWRRERQGPDVGLPEKQIKARYIPSIKGMKTKRRTPLVMQLDEMLGVKTADISAHEQIKEVRIALNKLSKDNIDEVRAALLKISITTMEALKSLGKMFMAKVLQEPLFWDTYIDLVGSLRWVVDGWTLRDAFLIELQRLFEGISDLDKVDACNVMRFIAHLYNEDWLSPKVFHEVLGRLTGNQASILWIEYAIVFMKACPKYENIEALRSTIMSRPSLTTRLKMLLICK